MVLTKEMQRWLAFGGLGGEEDRSRSSSDMYTQRELDQFNAEQLAWEKKGGDKYDSGSGQEEFLTTVEKAKNVPAPILRLYYPSSP
jgi:hypothetical protein